MSRGGFTSVARAVAWRNVHNYFTNPAIVDPRRCCSRCSSSRPSRAACRGWTACRASTTAPATRPSSTASCCCRPRPSAAIFTGFSVARDFESGFSRRLMLAARRRGGIVAGYWLAALTRAVFTIAGDHRCRAADAGSTSTAARSTSPALYTLALLVNAAAMLFGTGVAMRLRTMQAGAGDAGAGVPDPVPRAGLGALRPADGLGAGGGVGQPGHAAARDRARGFLAGDPTKVLPAFGVAALLVGVGLLWARGGLRSAERAA